MLQPLVRDRVVDHGLARKMTVFFHTSGGRRQASSPFNKGLAKQLGESFVTLRNPGSKQGVTQEVYCPVEYAEPPELTGFQLC